MPGLLKKLGVGRLEHYAAKKLDAVRDSSAFQEVRDKVKDVQEVRGKVKDVLAEMGVLRSKPSPRKKEKPKEQKRKIHRVEPTEPLDIDIEKATETILTRNSARLIANPTEAFAYVEQAINKAKKRIHINISSFADDSTGQRLAEIIIAAKKRNPQLELVIQVDQLGCFLLDSHKNILKLSILAPAFGKILFQYPEISFQKLVDIIHDHHSVYDIDPNIKKFLKKDLYKFLTEDLLLEENAPLRKLKNAGLLKVVANDLDQIDHSKVIVVDDETFLMGMNIGDPYSGGYDAENGKWGKKPESPTLGQIIKHELLGTELPDKDIPWHDFMIVSKGPATDIVEDGTFPQDRLNEIDRKSLEPQGDCLLRPLRNSDKEVKWEEKDVTDDGKKLNANEKAQRKKQYEDELKKEKQITFAIHHLIDNAEQEIIIDHAYTSDVTVVKKLETKAREGIPIRIMRGKAENEAFEKENDMALSGLIGFPNVTIHRIDKVIHSKTIIVDRLYAILGSANLTLASLHQHSELAFMASGKSNPVLQQLLAAHAPYIPSLKEPFTQKPTQNVT